MGLPLLLYVSILYVRCTVPGFLMLEKIISKIVPVGYDYRDAWWFISMGRRNEKKKKRILSIVFLAGTVFPSVAAVIASSGKDYSSMLFLCVSSLFSLFSLCVSSLSPCPSRILSLS